MARPQFVDHLIENFDAYPGMYDAYSVVKDDPDMMRSMIKSKCRQIIRTRMVSVLDPLGGVSVSRERFALRGRSGMQPPIAGSHHTRGTGGRL